MDELTNETKFVLQTLYKEYLDRSNNGISKIQAKEFKYAQFVYDELFSEMLYDDFYNSIMELDTQGSDCFGFQRTDKRSDLFLFSPIPNIKQQSAVSVGKYIVL